MDDWFSYKPSGQYCLEKTKKDNFDFYTFTPNPLCTTDLKIKVDARLLGLLSATHRLLGQIEGMSGFLPNVDAINSIMIQKEALLSCQIDGIEAPFYDVLDNSQKMNSKVLLIKNYASSLHYGLERLKKTHYKNSLLCDIHKRIILKEPSSDQGEFRDEYTSIGKIKILTNVPAYSPTAPTLLLRTMEDMEKFIRRDDDIDILIKAALSHYQFETIHPFMSGNGRVGRILSYMILADKKILTYPLLCLSHYLNIHKTEYFDRMETLHRQCNYEQWIEFFVKSIFFAADDAINSIKHWLCIREENLLKISKSDKATKALKLFYDAVECNPIFDVRTISQEVGASYNTGASAIKTLIDLGIVQQINHMQRNRIYACAGLYKFLFDRNPW